jgi:hypothetical protein
MFTILIIILEFRSIMDNDDYDEIFADEAIEVTEADDSELRLY